LPVPEGSAPQAKIGFILTTILMPRKVVVELLRDVRYLTLWALTLGSDVVDFRWRHCCVVLGIPTVCPLMLNALMTEDTYMAGSLLMVLSLLGVLGMPVSDLPLRRLVQGFGSLTSARLSEHQERYRRRLCGGQ